MTRSTVRRNDERRRLTDDSDKDVLRARREAAVRRLAGLCVEDPPDPATLSRELEPALDPGGLH